MKRFKSIDIFRGIGMVYIMVGYIIDWWSQPVDDGLFYVYVSLFSALGAAGFVFIDVIYDFSLIENKSEKKKSFKRKILFPSILGGTILITVCILYLYPNLFTERIFTIKTNFWWLIYTIGIDLVILMIFLIFEVFDIIKTKKSYKFLFYFSYYSLNLFLLQNINFFLFHSLLNRYNIWFFIMTTVILYGIFLRFLYIKLEGKFSLKVQIGRIIISIVNKNRNCNVKFKFKQSNE